MTLILTCLEHNKSILESCKCPFSAHVDGNRESIMTSMYTLLSVCYFTKEIKEDFLIEETLKELLFLFM